jgi:hypothetical protein
MFLRSSARTSSSFFGSVSLEIMLSLSIGNNLTHWPSAFTRASPALWRARLLNPLQAPNPSATRPPTSYMCKCDGRDDMDRAIPKAQYMRWEPER